MNSKGKVNLRCLLLHDNEIENDKLIYFFIWLLSVEMIIGGSGRLFAIGGISLRYILFGLFIIYFFLHVLKVKKIPRNIFTPLISLFIGILIIAFINGIANNYLTSSILGVLKSYLYLLIFFPLVIILCNKSRIDYIFEIMHKASKVIALSTIILFVGLLLFRVEFYLIVNPFLEKYSLGALAITESGLPRVFFRISPYLTIFAIYELVYICVEKQPKKSRYIWLSIFLIAIFITMTMGIWVAFAVGVIGFIFILKNKKVIKRFLIGLSTLGLLLSIVIGELVLRVLLTRFSKDDESLIIKTQQLQQLIEVWLEKPILGHGFGIEIIFNNELGTRVMTRFELYWIELLVHTGVIGFTIYVALIGQLFVVSVFLVDKYRDDKVAVTQIITICIGVLMLCITSFVNPFMNNPIGIFYLVVGLVCLNYYYYHWKKVGR